MWTLERRQIIFWFQDVITSKRHQSTHIVNSSNKHIIKFMYFSHSTHNMPYDVYLNGKYYRNMLCTLVISRLTPPMVYIKVLKVVNTIESQMLVISVHFI